LVRAFGRRVANDRLIAQLEADPQLGQDASPQDAALEARLVQRSANRFGPSFCALSSWRPSFVTVILMVWAITLNAPLEELANPNLTMNPAKAPWYFLGLQEMLVYFDPWMAGVVMPTLIIVGLMVIPYIDANPLGSGYYTLEAAAFRHRHVLLRLHAALAADGGDRDVHPRPGLDVVLAGANVGPQPPGVRGKPRFTRHVLYHLRLGKDHFRRRGHGHLLCRSGRSGSHTHHLE
jgi:hypothetical protein